MKLLTPLNRRICNLCGNNDLANFIRITGALGQILSSFAFIGSITTNDELPQKQKAFLTAQESIEGIINVLLFCLFTSKANTFTKSFIDEKRSFFFPKSTKNMFRGKKLISQNRDVINNLSIEVSEFNRDFPTFASFIGAIFATAIISPIIKNITSAAFLKLKDTKDKKDEIKNKKINTQSLRKKVLPLNNYITAVTSPKGLRL